MKELITIESIKKELCPALTCRAKFLIKHPYSLSKQDGPISSTDPR